MNAVNEIRTVSIKGLYQYSKRELDDIAVYRAGRMGVITSLPLPNVTLQGGYEAVLFSSNGTNEFFLKGTTIDTKQKIREGKIALYVGAGMTTQQAIKFYSCNVHTKYKYLFYPVMVDILNNERIVEAFVQHPLVFGAALKDWKNSWGRVVEDFFTDLSVVQQFALVELVRSTA